MEQAEAGLAFVEDAILGPAVSGLIQPEAVESNRVTSVEIVDGGTIGEMIHGTTSCEEGMLWALARLARTSRGNGAHGSQPVSRLLSHELTSGLSETA
nr:hypothetical protein [Saccharopolyspora sp. 6M]